MAIRIDEKPQSFISPGVTTPDNYIFGSGQLTGYILRPSGQWPIIRDDEIQARNFETNSCTSFGTINAVQSIFKELFKLDVNYSERFLAKGSGTDPSKGGNDPHKVAEWARKNGFVDEGILPFDSTLNTLTEYYAPLTPQTLKIGKEWLKKYTFLHDWLSDGSLIAKETLMKALRYSPIGCAVYAWAEEDGLYIRPEGKKDIHWIEICGFKENEYWIAIDSYPPFVKHLDWNYPLYFAKRFFVDVAPEKKTTFLKSVLDFIRNYLKELFT